MSILLGPAGDAARYRYDDLDGVMNYSIISQI